MIEAADASLSDSGGMVSLDGVGAGEWQGTG